MEGEVKVVGSKTTVKCMRTGTLTVKRMPRTLNLVARSDEGSEDKRATAYAYNVFRVCVVGCDGVTDFDGAPVDFKQARHPVLGMVCDDSLFDIVSEADILAVVTEATRHLGLSQEQRGN